MRIELPSGGFAIVSRDIKPETIRALDEMLIAAKKSIVMVDNRPKK